MTPATGATRPKAGHLGSFASHARESLPSEGAGAIRQLADISASDPDDLAQLCVSSNSGQVRRGPSWRGGEAISPAAPAGSRFGVRISTGHARHTAREQSLGVEVQLEPVAAMSDKAPAVGATRQLGNIGQVLPESLRCTRASARAR